MMVQEGSPLSLNPKEKQDTTVSLQHTTTEIQSKDGRSTYSLPHLVSGSPENG